MHNPLRLAVKKRNPLLTAPILGVPIWLRMHNAAHLLAQDQPQLAHSNWFTTPELQSATPKPITAELAGVTALDHEPYVPRVHGGNGLLSA